MNVFEEMAQALRDFKRDKTRIAAEILAEYENETNGISNANRLQMQKGLMPDGTQIRPEYASQKYANLKQRNPYNLSERPPFTPNLAYRGLYYKSLRVTIMGEQLLIDSDGSTRWGGLPEWIDGRYGSVLGIPDKWAEEELKPMLQAGLVRRVSELLINAIR